MNYVRLALCISACILPTISAIPIENGKCVKIYYNADDYYKIYCFRTINNVLSIKTDKNDTIELISSKNGRRCVKISGPNAIKPFETACEVSSRDNCYKEGESLSLPNEESGNVPCTKKTLDNTNSMSAKADKLVVVFDVIQVFHFIINVRYNRPERE